LIVVSDTGPIQYLLLVGLIDFLPVLYQQVVIPQAVFAELNQPTTPADVRAWIASPPS